MNTTQSINDLHAINDRLARMNATAEIRARAMQAAFVGEIVSAAIARVGKTVTRLVQAWREWSERRQSLAYLERLDERLLADIGLSHATLHTAIRHPVPKPAAGVVPPVEAVIAETATVATAANQDRGQDQGHGRVRVAHRNAA